jgi:hypothetical protein
MICCLLAFQAGCRVKKENIEEITTFSLGMVYGLCIHEPYLYATTNEGVEIFEMIGTGKLEHRESVKIGSEGAATFKVIAHNDILYVGGEAGVTILNLYGNDPFQTIGECVTAGTFIQALSLHGDYLFVSDYYKGLSVVDVGDPANPHTVANYDLQTGSSDVCLNGDVLYLANLSHGLLIFNISDPTEPELVDTVESSEGARSIFISQDNLYLGTYNAGIKIYDLSDAREPQFVRGFFDSEEIYVFHAENELIFCKNPESGVMVYELRGGDPPLMNGYYNGGLCHEALFYKGLIYFASRKVNVIRLLP